MVADRAFLKGGRLGAGFGRLEAEIARILAALAATGAMRVEPAALQPAELLLDLYGEDIRARAFVTEDEGAELMLRPDFTLPIVRLHMAAGAEPARYVYCGPVWRRQAAGSERPREYLQAGVEVFDGTAPSERDAEVLGLILDALGDAPVRLVTGDMGLVLAAIDGLETTEARRRALRRHVWRPHRFHALLERFGPLHGAEAARRAEMLAAAGEGRVPELIARAGHRVGKRSAGEIAERVAGLAAEAQTPALPQDAVDRLEAVLAVTGSAVEALGQLRRLARETPGLAAAVDRFEARLDACARRGIAPEGLAFEAGFGRTTLEYYDGFVFGALAPDRPDLPPIASGGRYDALTRALGQGRGIPAVGGIVRPEALLALAGGAP
ncbi:MAG TPA: ATP phosphoribosyltransferase regulatory subunit [Amaricoccus sp.]|uniref:ATP phosphoribosyltransferase regulatory subunit n=1 Tax=Amaricoccus sp. TaxID=1872485 RepID=UPI002CB7E950|nr:ATP phosphoribosyltransferase regulatory subunit [Amaricoccus sp.]HMR53487.1 ATP phosphoribosyltransferase regulatory subunit [Amaricoccus sp.]HMR60586.1 ATP phosphoribosyltransferase regulatory subunit [Amaricoccus sp.]HMU00455.1 ATP phosphoribosyltransferase regulatory subunit [Amaricoccus sp.]